MSTNSNTKFDVFVEVMIVLAFVFIVVVASLQFVVFPPVAAASSAAVYDISNACTKWEDVSPFSVISDRRMRQAHCEPTGDTNKRVAFASEPILVKASAPVVSIPVVTVVDDKGEETVVVVVPPVVVVIVPPIVIAPPVSEHTNNGNHYGNDMPDNNDNDVNNPHNGEDTAAEHHGHKDN